MRRIILFYQHQFIAIIAIFKLFRSNAVAINLSGTLATRGTDGGRWGRLSP
jgi:hypothetical protein